MKAQYVHPKRAELTRVLDVPVETLKHEEPLACARYIQKHVIPEASALSSRQHNCPLLVHNDSLNEWANQILDNEAAYRLDDGETITVVIDDDEEDGTSSEQDNEARGGIVRVRSLIDDEARYREDRSDDGFTIWVRSIEDGSSGGDGRMMKIPPNIEAESLDDNDDDDDEEEDETSYDEDGYTICLSSSDSSHSAFTIYFSKHKGTSISSVSFSDSISSCSTW